MAAESARLERMGERLGLFGVQQRSRRKLQRTGNSVTVSLDPALVRECLGEAGPGTEVDVGRQGDHIVIRKAGTA